MKCPYNKKDCLHIDTSDMNKTKDCCDCSEYPISEKLKGYFNSTPREQIMADWEATKKYDKVGITVKDYLKIFNKYHEI